MSFEISKLIRFEAGHRLLKYKGKCNHIHGHSYSADITLECNTLDGTNFVMDFSLFKPIKDWIDENWDHAMLINAADHKLHEFLKEQGFQYYIFAEDPTAERIAERLGQLIFVNWNSWFAAMLENRVRLKSVVIHETKTGLARWVPGQLVAGVKMGEEE